MTTIPNTSALRLLTFGEVMDRVGLTRSHIYKLIAADRFPAPVELDARRVAFVEHEITAWIQARVDERAAPEVKVAREARSRHFAGLVEKRWGKSRAEA